jgi:hypothetical protein
MLALALGLAGAAGLAATAAATPNQLDDFYRVAEMQGTTVLDVVASPELAGAPCQIMNSGMIVGSTVLAPGHNLVAVPSLPGGYTAIGPFEPKQEQDPGVNW